MRIWILNHYAVPLEYYPHGRPHWFAEELARKGHEIIVFAASSVHNSDVNLITDGRLYRTEKRNGVLYVYLKAKSYTGNGMKRVCNMIQYAVNVYRVRKKFPSPDRILAMSVHPLTCVVGIILSRKYKAKCVVDIADLWPESLKDYGLLGEKSILLKLLYAGEYWIYKNADAIVFTMEGGNDYIKRHRWDKKIDLKKVSIINNGIDLKAFDYNAEHYQSFDPELNDENKFKIIYTGSLRQANDIKTIMEVAKIAQEDGQRDIQFFIYGEGEEKENLILYCSNNNILNVHFKNKVEKKYIPNILQKADINIWHFINSGVLEYGGSPNKLFEYLAAGRPILSTNKINYNLVERFNAGIANKVGASEEIYKSLLYMKHLPELELAKMGKNARTAAKEYDFSKLTEQLEIVLKR